jgi:hypothetical protein
MLQIRTWDFTIRIWLPSTQLRYLVFAAFKVRDSETSNNEPSWKKNINPCVCLFKHYSFNTRGLLGGYWMWKFTGVNVGCGRGGVVNSPPPPRRERTLVPFGQQSGWPPDPAWMLQNGWKPRLAMFRIVILREITDMNNNGLSDVRYTCVYLFITIKCKQLEIIHEVCRIPSPFFKSQISKRRLSKKSWKWCGCNLVFKYLSSQDLFSYSPSGRVIF